MRFPDIPSTSIKLMLFPFSLEALEKEPPRSILTWEILFQNSNSILSSFKIRQNLQKRDHEISTKHLTNTFYNTLNANDQDSLNSAAGGNFLDKMPCECLKIIESKSKVLNSRNKAVISKDLMKTMLIDKQKAQAPVPVKAVEQSYVTCGGAHSYRNCPDTDGICLFDDKHSRVYVSQAATANFNQGNTNFRPSMVANQI
ncbi:hypothetical protein Tco_0497867 [Tanacetum coccineum]